MFSWKFKGLKDKYCLFQWMNPHNVLFVTEEEAQGYEYAVTPLSPSFSASINIPKSLLDKGLVIRF